MSTIFRTHTLVAKLLICFHYCCRTRFVLTACCIWGMPQLHRAMVLWFISCAMYTILLWGMWW